MADDRNRDNIRAEFVRRLISCRCPEVTLADLELAFGNSAESNRDTLAEIADAVGDAIAALEQRLSELERGAP